jgi:ribosome-binding factor A
MVDQARARRLAKRISQIVADALEHEVKDPRLSMVTITDARVTGDLRDATVYYTVLGRSVDDVPDSAGAAAALASATGVLRSMVGAGTGVRFTPTLTFVPDAVPDEARRMEELLARTRESDAEVARRAVGAQPAGDPDPYRRKDEADDQDGDLSVLRSAPFSSPRPEPAE